MFREEIRYQDNQDMARNVLFTDNGKECQHCYKKEYIKEDCWLLYLEKNKEKQKEKEKEIKISGAEQDRG